MTTTEEAPAYEVFRQPYGQAGDGKSLAGWLRSLQAGVPERAPEDRNYVSITRTAHTIFGAGKYAIRRINGEIWVCRLKNEDFRQ